MLKVVVSPMGLLLWSLFFFLLSGEEFVSLLAAVAAHEIGHVLSLWLFGIRAETIALTGTGLRIDCSRALAPIEELISSLAGPAFGVLWFFAALEIGMELSAGLSILLTVFNMLPLSAMDGGRALHAIMCIISGTRSAAKASGIIDIVLSAAMCAAALWCAINGLGAGAAVAAAWLVIYTVVTPCKTRMHSIK